MTRLAALVSVALLAFGSFALRRIPADEEGNLSAAACAVPSAEAYRERLIELSLAGAAAPRWDRFLDHPEGRAVPWPPLHHGGLAAIAQLVAGQSGEPRQLGGVGEEELRRVLALAQPAAGALATLAVFLAGLCVAVFALGLDARRGLGVGLGAALLYAVSPLAIPAASEGRLDPGPWLHVFIALQWGALALALRGREPFDRSGGAMVAGLCSGLALLTDLTTVPLFLLAGFLLLARASAALPGEAQDGRRAALLFGLAAAALAALGRGVSLREPALDPAEGLLPLAAAVTLPALVLGLPAVARWRPALRLTAALAVAALFFALIPGVPAWVAAQARLFASVPLPPASGPLVAASVLGLLASAVGVARLPRASGRAVWGVVLLGALGLSLIRGAPTGGLAVFVALATACGLLARRSGRGIRSLAPRALFGLTVIAGLGPLARPAPIRAAEVSPREAFTAGLRWLRTGSPAAGPWNHAAAKGDFGLLVDPAYAGLAVREARRPVTTDARWLAGMAGADGARVAETLRAAGILYVVVTPPMILRMATPPDAVLTRLALSVGRQEPVAGFELVFTSKILVGLDGGPGARGDATSGPAISIYRLAGGPWVPQPRSMETLRR